MIPKDISPQVNVLISTYNGKSYLLEQFESLYQQTHPNIKIIVRDDGSSDLTLDICKRGIIKKISLDNSNSNIGPAKSFLNYSTPIKMLTFTPFVTKTIFGILIS